MAFKVVDQVKGHHGHGAQFIARDDIQGKIGRNIFFLRRSGCALLRGRGGAVRLALGVCGLGWLLRLLPIGGGGRGGTVRLTLGVRGLGRLLRFLPISGSGGGGAFRLALGVRGLGGLLGLLPIGGRCRGGAVRLTLGVRRLGRLLRFLPIGGSGGSGAVCLTLGVCGLWGFLQLLRFGGRGRSIPSRFLLGGFFSRRLARLGRRGGPHCLDRLGVCRWRLVRKFGVFLRWVGWDWTGHRGPERPDQGIFLGVCHCALPPISRYLSKSASI